MQETPTKTWTEGVIKAPQPHQLVMKIGAATW